MEENIAEIIISKSQTLILIIFSKYKHVLLTVLHLLYKSCLINFTVKVRSKVGEYFKGDFKRSDGNIVLPVFIRSQIGISQLFIMQAL